MMTRMTAIALGLALGLAASPALAQETQQDDGPSGVLRLGKLYSFGGGAQLEHGFGMDLRYELYPTQGLDGYTGLFAQGQYELGDAWRMAGGLTGGWGAFGLEVGVSHRTATSAFAGSTGLHIGQSLTFGPVSIGGRLTIPLVDHLPQNVAIAPGVQGIEGAVTLRMSFGFTVHGQRRGHRSCHAHGGRVRNPHGQHGH